MEETPVWFLGWEDPPEEGMGPTPVFWLGESHGQRSLAGYSSWGHKELDMTEQQISNRYCGDHFSVYTYIFQIIVLYAWNKYSVVCQLYLNTKSKKLNDKN